MLKIKDSMAALPASDIKRARQFYEQKLGLTPSEEQPDGGVQYKTGNTAFLVFPSRGKASGDHTQIGLEVEDINAAVNELKSKGAKIEEYDYPDFKTVNGIVDMADMGKGAWFKDTEGNLISLLQRAPVAATSTSKGSTSTSR
jgi:predicted enzyme related to lactoylglutathione lyase